MKKVCFVCDWGETSHSLLQRYSKQTPNQNGMWNDLQGTANHLEADYIVIMDGAPKNFEIDDWSKVIYFQREPMRQKYWMDHNFPSDIFFDGRYENFHNVVVWWVDIPFNKLVKVPYSKKTKNISTITSGARVLKEHQQRLDFLSRISKDIDIDVYGRGVLPYIERDRYRGALSYNGNCKFLGHYKYYNSLVLENTLLHNSWSEKPADSFLSWSRPIYWGANNFNEYFPDKSYVQLDSDLTNISSQEFKEALEQEICLESLKEARSLILYHYQIWASVEKIIKER